jgi:hypothetical protein
VDVDLSEKVFESVVIESEGHALSIQIQYEKQPLYCANCKMIGHSIQSCVKINAPKPEGPARHMGSTTGSKQNPHTGSKQNPHVLSLRQQEKQPVTQTYMHNIKEFIPQQIKPMGSTKITRQPTKPTENQTAKNKTMFDVSNSNLFVDLSDNSTMQNLISQGGLKKVANVTVVNQESVTPPPLNLNNAFEILANTENELPEGEALLAEKELVPSVLKPVELVSTEIDCLDPKDGLEVPCKLQKGPSVVVVCAWEADFPQARHIISGAGHQYWEGVIP